MPEVLSAPENTLLRVDVRNDGIIDGANENQIKRFAYDYAVKERGTLTDREFKGLVNRIDTLLKQHDIEFAGLGEKLERAKQEVRTQTREKTGTVRELQLSDIRSPAGLSHYIDRSGDETMKILEEQIGLDSTWKILALTTAHTSIELGKGLADILKFGEGTAEGMFALDRKDLSRKEKALEIAKGIGVDGLRALGIVGGVGALGKVLAKAKPSQIITETATKSASQAPKSSIPEPATSSQTPNNPTPATSPTGVSPDVPVSANPQPPQVGPHERGTSDRKLGEVLKYQRGAVGDLSRTGSSESSIKAVSPAIGDLERNFNLPSFKPIDGLHALESLNKYLNLKELIGNFRGIEEFTRTIEKISTYIVENRSKIGPKLAEDMFQEIKNLRDNVSKILEGGEFNPVKIQPLKTVLRKDIDKALISLKPELFQPIK